MKEFNNQFKVGTKVKLAGIQQICTIKWIHETRRLIQVNEYLGSFQRGHIQEYSNK